MTEKQMSSPSDYMVRLSDGNVYCFYPSRIYDNRFCKTIIYNFKVRTIESVKDEDWKTAITQNKKIIPSNTELKVLNVINNFYGRWLEVIYDNSLYYINPLKVEYAGIIKKEVLYNDN